jgi:hypothetical protein
MTTLIPKYDLKNGGAIPTGAINRPFNEKLNEIVSVKDFGAIGNGSADDTTAINNALAFISNGGTLYFPAGIYLCSQQVTLNSNISLIGVGRTNTGTQYSSTIEFTNSSSCGIITALGGGYNRISDMTLVGTGNSSGTGLYVIKSAFSVFERLFIREFQYGIIDVAVQNISYNDIVINTVQYGVYWTTGSASDYHTVCTYKSIYVSGVSNVGFYIHGGTTTPICKENTFIDCAADGANVGWQVLSCFDTTFIGSYTELCTQYGFYVTNSKSLNFIGCYVGESSGTSTSAYVPLYSSNNSGCTWDRFTYNTSVVTPTYDMQFLGGATYFNAVTNYTKENGGGAASIQSNNVLTSFYSSTSQPNIVATISNALTMTNQSIGGSVGASGAASALPANPASYITVNINGFTYRIPLYN